MVYQATKTQEVERPSIFFRPSIDEIYEAIQEQGAFIIRDSASDVGDFEKIASTLMRPMIHHATNTIERDPVNRDGSTSTVNKGMDAIPFHREGSYAPGTPDILALYCIRPATEGGETLLCDGAQLVNGLPARVSDFFKDAYITWSWTVPPERWRKTLSVATPEEARARLSALEQTFESWESLLSVEFDGDTLQGRYRTRAVIPTKWKQEGSFCNSLLIHTFRTASEYYAKPLFTPTLDDGSPFPMWALEAANDCAQAHAIKVEWRPGDILVIDNSRFMHGRNAFTDRERRILIQMGYAPDGLR